jgi:predicted DNA-binding protein with PD1-like motif
MDNTDAPAEELDKQRQFPESSYTDSEPPNGDSGSNHHNANANAANDTASTPQWQQKKRGRRSSKSKSEDGTQRHEMDNDGTAIVPIQPEFKRPRGRPPGSKNKVLKSGPPLIPLVLHIQPGEDIVTRLKDTAKQYKRSLVILAATGTLRVATLTQLQPSGPGVGVTVKGEFAMLSMSGSILQGSISDEANAGGKHSKDFNVFLSVSLATAQGGVLGGSVAGVLEASSQGTVIVGHWDGDRRQDGEDEKERPRSSSMYLQN